MDDGIPEQSKVIGVIESGGERLKTDQKCSPENDYEITAENDLGNDQKVSVVTCRDLKIIFSLGKNRVL